MSKMFWKFSLLIKLEYWVGEWQEMKLEKLTSSGSIKKTIHCIKELEFILKDLENYWDH